MNLLEKDLLEEQNWEQYCVKFVESWTEHIQKCTCRLSSKFDCGQGVDSLQVIWIVLSIQDE